MSSGVPSMQASPGTGLCPLPGSGLEPEGLKASFVERGAVAQETRPVASRGKQGPGSQLSSVVWGRMGQFKSSLESGLHCAVGPQASLLSPPASDFWPVIICNVGKII